MSDEIRDGNGVYVVRRDTVREFNAILQRDSKDTTYKFALLRALAEIAEQDEHLVRPHDAEWVSFPLGLVVDRWLRYYYPLIEQGLPQQRSDGRLTFWPDFAALTTWYATRGQFVTFWRDYSAAARLPETAARIFLRLIRKLRKTIVHMPMKYLGVSLEGRCYSIARPAPGERPAYGALARAGGGRAAVVAHLGTALLRRDFHEALRALGGFATGTEALLMEWARFTARASKRRGKRLVTVERALAALLVTPEADRDVAAVQGLWSARLARGEAVDCVWTGRRLSPEHLVIDHAIPFSLWGNNALWNLLPVLDQVNRQKSDSIPAVMLIHARRDAIAGAWRAMRAAHADLFDRDVALSLGATIGADWERAGIEALARKCRYLVDERGYRSWQPA